MADQYDLDKFNMQKFYSRKKVGDQHRQFNLSQKRAMIGSVRPGRLPSRQRKQKLQRKMVKMADNEYDFPIAEQANIQIL